MSYQYTNRWFENTAKSVWNELIPKINPTRILEIGSYEGASACYLIDQLAAQKSVELHCIDTWQGGLEHQNGSTAHVNMADVEQRFYYNTQTAIANAAHNVELVIHKGPSDVELPKLLAGGKQGYFDFIYIDGSHQAPDVLFDALLGFELLKIGGVIAFDDYLWHEPLPNGIDPIRCPKIAIDAFTTIFCRKVRPVVAPTVQIYVQKVSD